MPIERIDRPFVVGFDGLHRTGKGTQAAMLRAALREYGGRSVILRGDGTRPGLGTHQGDPFSEEWQQRGEYIKSPSGNTVENWNAASYLLVRELAEKKNEIPQQHDALIVDRTVLSRAEFLLHRGVALEGRRLTLDEMYPNNALAYEEQIDLEDTVPDVIFELKTSSPRNLLLRLDQNDPKYTFRARNIRGGFNAAAIAKEHLPAHIERRVITLDAEENPEALHEKVKHHLSKTALSHFLDSSDV